jgi:hypothetical protein
MTTKASKASPPGLAPPAVEADALGKAEVDAFITRNRDELNASIVRSREEVARGVRSARTVADIIADGRKRHSAG